MNFIYTDCANISEARRIGRTIVDQGLAACASWWRVKSAYSWRGKLREQAEAALLIKTSARFSRAAVNRLRELHSYELPVVVAWHGSTNQSAESWISGMGRGISKLIGIRSEATLRRSSVRRLRARA